MVGSGSGWLDLHNTKATSGCRTWGDRIASKVAIIRNQFSVDSSRRSDQAPGVTNFLIEMTGGRRLGRGKQKGLYAFVDHEAAFSVPLVELQLFERLDHPTDRHHFS
jgi:hypothetical protein